jgi:hypothetical protein
MQVINLTIAFPEIRFNEIDFPPDTEPDDVFPRTSPFVGAGITPDIDIVEFDTTPTQVTAILTGFRVWFQKPSDRELGLLEVRVGVPIKLTETQFQIPVNLWAAGLVGAMGRRARGRGTRRCHRRLTPETTAPVIGS